MLRLGQCFALESSLCVVGAMHTDNSLCRSWAEHTLVVMNNMLPWAKSLLTTAERMLQM
jgi:hypothetical protein